MLYDNFKYDDILSHINNIILNKIKSDSIILTEKEIDFNKFKTQKLILQNIIKYFTFDKKSGLIICTNDINNIYTILNISETNELTMTINSNIISYNFNDQIINDIITIENKPIHIAFLISYIIENKNIQKKYLYSLDNNCVTILEENNNGMKLISSVKNSIINIQNKFREIFQNEDFYNILGKTAITLLNILQKNIENTNINEILINTEPKIQFNLLQKLNWKTNNNKLISVDEWLKYNKKYKDYLKNNNNIKNILHIFVKNINDNNDNIFNSSDNDIFYRKKNMIGSGNSGQRDYLNSNALLSGFNSIQFGFRNHNKKIENKLYNKIYNLIKLYDDIYKKIIDIFDIIKTYLIKLDNNKFTKFKNIYKYNNDFLEPISLNHMLEYINYNDDIKKKFLNLDIFLGKLPILIETQQISNNNNIININ